MTDTFRCRDVLIGMCLVIVVVMAPKFAFCCIELILANIGCTETLKPRFRLKLETPKQVQQQLYETDGYLIPMFMKNNLRFEENLQA